VDHWQGAPVRAGGTGGQSAAIRLRHTYTAIGLVRQCFGVVAVPCVKSLRQRLVQALHLHSLMLERVAVQMMMLLLIGCCHARCVAAVTPAAAPGWNAAVDD